MGATSASSVAGGRGRSGRCLQAGNSVHATWRARLDEHLGNYAIEGATLRAAKLMETPAGLYGVQALGGLVRLLPERDPHPQIYAALAAMVDLLDDPLLAGGLIVRFELRMLEELGFGLDLDSCVATGTNDDLAYVSPKSGRAVSRSAGDPYRERMLPTAGLPARDARRAAGAGGSSRRLPAHRILPRPPRL